MNKILKIFAACAVLASSLVSCKGPEYEIVSEINLKRCLMPTNVTAQVKYVTCTFDWKVYADAEFFELEIYSQVPQEGEEPDPGKLLFSQNLVAAQLPFEYLGPDETKCWYRLRSVNTTKEKSTWATGTFVTDVDPSTQCTKPSDVSVTAVCEKVKFDWTTYPNTTVYEVEIYKKAFPSEGEPAAADLEKTLKIGVLEIPHTEKLSDIDHGKHWYRVRATNPGSGLKNSKWVTGSFETSAFNWPVDETAINTTTKQSFTGVVKTFTAGWYNGFYLGSNGTLYGDHVSMATLQSSQLTSEYGPLMPTLNYLAFKICKPGELSAPLYSTNSSTAVIAILATKQGEGKKAKYIKEVTDITNDTSKAKANPTKVIITEDDLYGITEAAMVYIFSGNKKGLQYYAITWTPDTKY